MTSGGIALHRHEDALFGRVFGHQPPVAGMDPGDDRRLVVGELLVVRQVAAEIPDREPRDAARRDPGQNHQKQEKLDDFHGASRRRRSRRPSRPRGPPLGIKVAAGLWRLQGAMPKRLRDVKCRLSAG